MTTSTIETSITIEKALYTRAEALAQQLNISTNELFERAVETLVQSHQAKIEQASRKNRVVNQGEIYWVQLEDTNILHPHVVVQDDVFNHSRISTVVVCALTTNMKKANLPGNVLLEAGEANLPKQSIVEVSKVSVVEKTLLGEFIGTLTQQRIGQILAGMRFIQTSFF